MKPVKISDVITHQIESMILDGGLRPGDRLPPERELAARFEVSRPSLREAIKKLETRGLVEIRRGGGTYVSDLLDQTFSNPLMGLLHHHPETLYDLVEMRESLESVAAYYAAVRATEEDRAALRQRYEAMIEAHENAHVDPATDARRDAEFHIGIAEAAHNVVLLYIMRGLFNLLQSGISTSLERLYTRPGNREIVGEQHQELFDAIIAGDGETARQAAQRHLQFVKRSLVEIDEEEKRIERSRRRLHGLVD